MKKKIFLAFLACSLMAVHAYSQIGQEIKNDDVFSFQKPFHSLGFSVFTGINFAPKLHDHSGDIKPILFPALVPEFILQYNFMIKNGFGIALEVPFGIFRRYSLTPLSDYGASNDVWLEMGSLYIGFTGKITVFKELNSNICMQGELGLKFNPFSHPADRWYNKDYYTVTEWYYYDDNTSINFTKVEQKYYAIPDATASVLFFFHSKKKPKHNFVLGLNANLSFVKRIKVIYDTSFSELGLVQSPNTSFGNYGWNSTAVGITVGYRFFGVK